MAKRQSNNNSIVCHSIRVFRTMWLLLTLKGGRLDQSSVVKPSPIWNDLETNETGMKLFSSKIASAQKSLLQSFCK